LLCLLACGALQAAEPRHVTWADVAPPIQGLLISQGIHERNFGERTAELRQRNRDRVIEGDRDHLVYFALQSTAFTSLPPIEPALSARELAATGRIPPTARARLDAFAAASRARRDYGPRMAIFRELLERSPIDLSEEYVRAMKFAAPTGTQYQLRGLSTDTSVDAGYAVYLALGALRRLEPGRQIRNLLIIGPGLDLAPRTGFVERHEPQSYQPFAVIDAVLSTGLAMRPTLRMTAADINPRVVEYLNRLRVSAPTLTLIAGVAQSGRVRLTEDYRSYFASLGRTIGVEQPLRGLKSGQLGKSIAIGGGVASAIDTATMDVTVERLDERYDLIVVTNVLPYLSDGELLLATGNIFGMLNPGGILIHNEPRPLLAQALLALRMPLLQARSGVVATVDDSATPLYDAVWMHRAPTGHEQLQLNEGAAIPASRRTAGAPEPSQR
jgi:Nodulation protein S (NodS)